MDLHSLDLDRLPSGLATPLNTLGQALNLFLVPLHIRGVFLGDTILTIDNRIHLGLVADSVETRVEVVGALDDIAKDGLAQRATRRGDFFVYGVGDGLLGILSRVQVGGYSVSCDLPYTRGLESCAVDEGGERTMKRMKIQPHEGTEDRRIE